MEGTATSLRPEIAAALEWWRAAGVDLDFVDDPVLWLAPPQDDRPALPAAFMAAPEVAARTETDTGFPGIGGPKEAWPAVFSEFAPWWLNEPLLDHGTVRGRVAPRGPKEAELMVIVAQPEPDDGDALLSGPHGNLAAAILLAIGIAPENVYFASALPRHMPAANWEALAAQGLGEVLRHHIALAAPRRILAFGSVIPSLLGHDPAQISGFSLTFKHEDRSIGVLAARDLAFLAAKPAAKARLWQRLLDFWVLDTSGPAAPERTGTV